MLLSVSTQAYNCEHELYILTQFALQYKRLHIVGELLLDLIEFYQWIHLDLIRHRVKREYAETHTLESIIIKIDEANPERKLYQLYEKVLGKCFSFYKSMHTVMLLLSF